MTDSTRSINVKIWLPALVIILSAALWALTTWQEYSSLTNGLIRSSELHIKRDMVLLQREIETELRTDHSDEAEQAITSRGVNTRHQTLVMIDDQGVIRFSTRFAQKRQQAEQILPDFEPTRFERLQLHNHADIKLEQAKNRFTVYYPLVLERQNDELRSRRIGAIFMVYDYSDDLAAIWQILWHTSLSIGAALIVAVLIFFLFAHIFITRPVKHLISATRAIADGNFDVASNIDGQGEFAQLSAAFNRMAEQLRSQRAERDKALSALRKKEQWQRQLLNTLPHGVQENDTDGVITYSNAAHHRIMGLRQNELIGRYIWDFQPDEDRKRETLNYLNYLLEQQPEPTPYISTNLTRDGKEVTLEVVWDYQRNDAGEVTGFISIISDITTKTLTERALQRSQKMDAIGQLTGGIAHDFNNILSIIIGNLNLLQRQDDLDSATQKRLDTITHSTQRAIDLTQQLLGFSSREASETETVDINTIIKNSQNLISQSLTPQVEAIYLCTDDIWQTEINAGDFEDVLLNLALNARDAMDGRGKLTIETHNSVLDEGYCSINPGARPGKYVQLSVSDDGSGMTTDQIDRIFEPFFTTKAQGKGTGLGLSMVFGFVKRSGGHIKVYSEPGIGTTFRIYLPQAQSTQSVAKAEPEHNEVLPRGQETILVVDDELDLLEMVETTLQQQGYTVITASDGNGALALLAQHPEIDLLFSDVVMPGGLNGYELAEQACKLYPDLGVLLTSGYTEMAIARNGQARFNANLLSKPYTLSELINRIHETLREL